MRLSLLIRRTSSVVTCNGPISAGAASALDAQPGACVGVAGAKVAFIGGEGELPAGAVDTATQVLDAAGGFVGPGFVDPHTHVVFAGERSLEFEMRCAGANYLDIAQKGGGIASTVRATRAASEEDLFTEALPRLRRLLSFGVTTAEVKSGYGLSVAEELKLLRVISKLGQAQPISLHATLLALHAAPPDAPRDAYLKACVEELLPQVAAQRLARFVDAFVEKGAFTASETRPFIDAAKRLGLGVKLHVDQLNAGGGAEFAADVRAVSADHLENISDAGARALAQAGVVATLMPTSTLFLRQKFYAPGRKLWDLGVPMALASNVNPGSAMSENHALALGLACLENGLTPQEAYWASTRGGALALALTDAGRLAVQGPADLVIFGCPHPRMLPYHLGISQVRSVVKGGQLVWSAPAVGNS
ncbi:MAG: imidazolonepropionase [Myxococcaceae bacterium]